MCCTTAASRFSCCNIRDIAIYLYEENYSQGHSSSRVDKAVTVSSRGPLIRSCYIYIRNALLIRLLKILRQPTTGFVLLGAHQVGAVPEFPSTLCST
ncbi:hypothetical protein CSKR_110348 [Clonorchis sinensis]|uniref:Uncharacterized protein n=1 Tax=Clonorchis sinensis TaxID=79923 RepID=A0A419QFL6_CLOSI|nr:hypothetical protein CSKR_110348 [Clonorchis sinensis]